MQQAAEVVAAVRRYIEDQQFFSYYTVNDERVCDKCDPLNYSSMTRTEIKGRFPNLIKYSPTMWVPMVHPNCRCVLMFEESDEPTPKPGALTTKQLIDKVSSEIIDKYVARSVVADDPKPSNVLTQFKDLSKDIQINIIRHEVELKTKDADYSDLEDDEDLWDLIALGILDTLHRRNKREQNTS